MQIWIITHDRCTPIKAYFDYENARVRFRALQADKWAVGHYGLISIEIEDTPQPTVEADVEGLRRNDGGLTNDE